MSSGFDSESKRDSGLVIENHCDSSLGKDSQEELPQFTEYFVILNPLPRGGKRGSLLGKKRLDSIRKGDRVTIPVVWFYPGPVGYFNFLEVADVKVLSVDAVFLEVEIAKSTLLFNVRKVISIPKDLITGIRSSRDIQLGISKRIEGRVCGGCGRRIPYRAW